MYKKTKINLSENQSRIVKCIFKGMTIPQIASELCRSQSCISYHINLLYEKYKAKNRSEFVLSVFGDILDRYKNAFEKLQSEIISLKSQNSEMKKIIKALMLAKDNQDCFEDTILQAEKYL